MKKRITAIIAAVCAIAIVGCGTGGSSTDSHGGPDTDSFPAESGITESDSDVSSSHVDDTVSQIVPIKPADTESVAASEDFRSFLNWEEDTNDGKVYNIFCGDEEFMRIVARYCDSYEPESETGNESGNESGDQPGDESGDQPGSDSGDSEDTASENSETPDRNFSETIYHGRIGSAEIRWIICHEVGERYLTDLDLSLLDESDPNNVTDLYIVDALDVQKYADPEYQAAMPLIRDAGLPASDFSAQYAYTKLMGSGDDGVQRAVSYGISPGVFMYDRQAAVDVLGSDDPAGVQAELSDWESFEAVAAKAGEKGYAMLSDWNNSFDAFAVSVSGDWLTETGGVRIDSALRAWTDQSELFKEKGYFAEGERPIFGTFISADEIMDLALSAGEDDLAGKYGICAGPAGWYRGGSFIMVNSLCDQRSLTKKLLEEIVFNRDVLRALKEEGIIPNSKVVLSEKIAGPTDPGSDTGGPGKAEEAKPESGAEGTETAEAEESGSGAQNSEAAWAVASDGSVGESENLDESEPDDRPRAIESVRAFLGGQDPYPVFAEAADKVALGNVSVFDKYLCDIYGREFAAYFAGEKEKDAAIRVFYTEVSDLISEEE